MTIPLSIQLTFSRPMSAATNCRPFITAMPTTRQCCGWRLAGSLHITTATIWSQATGPCENTQLFLMCPNALLKSPAPMLLPSWNAYLPDTSPTWKLIGGDMRLPAPIRVAFSWMASCSGWPRTDSGLCIPMVI